MKKHTGATQSKKTLLLLFPAISLCTMPAAGEFCKVDGIDSARVRQVAVAAGGTPFMAVASDNTLYTSHDGGASFRKTSVLKDEQITRIAFDPSDGRTVYLAASRNGYRIGARLERIFSARDREELFHLVRHGDILYAATSEGLYRSDVTLISWSLVAGLTGSTVRFIESSGSDLYLAGDRGVWLYRPDGTLRRLFVASDADISSGPRPLQVRMDVQTPSRLWLCTAKGVYVSDDRGNQWRKFYIAGAGNTEARCITQFPLDGSAFYLCSSAGFFRVDAVNGQSTALYEGLPTSSVHWAELTADGDIYLATDQGLFRQFRTPARKAMTAEIELESLMEGEPSIEEVQEAAMRYNSVHPDKTAHWRKRLPYRALMPRLSVDYDKTIGSSFTSSGYYYAQGPYDWGVSLTWDMGDLIWNSYEDDIDNRTKLTTQLRMDILDEVNRLYFERLRLKHEIALARMSIESTTLRELRLAELTATLDGYTGGIYIRRKADGLY